MLEAAGLTRIEQLRDLGPVVCFLAVQQAGQKPSLNLLWALAAGLRQMHWTSLTLQEKDRLREELHRLTR